MAAEAPAGKAPIPHHDDQPSSRHENPEPVPPDLIELVQEGLVVVDEPQLTFPPGIGL